MLLVSTDFLLLGMLLWIVSIVGCTASHILKNIQKYIIPSKVNTAGVVGLLQAGEVLLAMVNLNIILSAGFISLLSRFLLCGLLLLLRTVQRPNLHTHSLGFGLSGLQQTQVQVGQQISLLFIGCVCSHSLCVAPVLLAGTSGACAKYKKIWRVAIYL